MTLRSLAVVVVLLVIWSSDSASAAATEVALPQGLEKPLAIAVDEDGVVWFTLDGSWAIGRHDPATDETTSIPLAEPRSGEADSLYGILIGTDGAIWTASQTNLHRIDVRTREATAQALPARTDLSGGLHQTADGTVFVGLVTSDAVARRAPSGEITSVSVPGQEMGPLEFADAANDAYVSMTYGNTYARLDPSTGAVTSAPKNLVAAPTGIAFDGDSLWMGEHGGNNLVRIDPDTNAVERFPTAPSPYYPITGPSGIVLHPDGSIWFAVHFADRIARFDPETGTMVEYEVPSAPGTNVQKVGLAPDGKVWFAEWSRNKIGHAEYGGEAADFDVPATAAVAVDAATRVAADLEGDIRVGTPDTRIKARFDNGTLVFEADPDAPTGKHNVLVSRTDGKTYVGRYMTLTVEPKAESPSAPVALVVPAVALLALLLRRSRA